LKIKLRVKLKLILRVKLKLRLKLRSNLRLSLNLRQLPSPNPITNLRPSQKTNLRITNPNPLSKKPKITSHHRTTVLLAMISRRLPRKLRMRSRVIKRLSRRLKMIKGD